MNSNTHTHTRRRPTHSKGEKNLQLEKHTSQIDLMLPVSLTYSYIANTQILPLLDRMLSILHSMRSLDNYGTANPMGSLKSYPNMMYPAVDNSMLTNHQVVLEH